MVFFLIIHLNLIKVIDFFNKKWYNYKEKRKVYESGEEMNNKQNTKITSRDVDFAKWYTDVVTAAKLASYSKTKGCLVIEPNGYAI